MEEWRPPGPIDFISGCAKAELQNKSPFAASQQQVSLIVVLKLNSLREAESSAARNDTGSHNGKGRGPPEFLRIQDFITISCVSS